MSDLNNYQSGGRGYIGPNQAIEQATYREFMNQSGGKEGIASMDQAQIANILQGMLERIANETKMANEELSQMVSAIRDSVMNASNSQQGAKDGMNLINKIISSNTNLMQGLQNQKTTSSSEKGILGAINNSPIKQMVHLNQGILNTIRQIDSRLEKAGLLMGKIQSDMIDISIDNNADNDRNHAEQMEEFDGLRQTIAHGLINSPLATKLGQLGSSLISLGLMKVMGNEKIPEPLRKAAATAIYLEVPQTLMMILGTVVGQKFSSWLSGSVAKHLGSSVGNVLNWIKANPMLLMRIGGGALIAAGAVTAITGAIKHHKEMKANDEAIENSNMSRAQKDMAKIGAHTKSGAKVGGLSGFLAGAGAGAIYGAGAGAVAGGIGAIPGAIAGAVIGGIGGLLGGGALGGLIGSIKPLLQGIWHGIQFIGSGIMAGAKWAIENREKIIKFLQPIGQTLFTILSITSPFFLAFRVVFDWVRNLMGNKNAPSIGSSVGNALQTAKEFFTGPSQDKLVKMSDLGLQGRIDGGNSKPLTRKENAYNVKQLDYLLSSWGYGVTYTSNMGGAHMGGARSHASGNKIDLQLTKGGKTAYLNDWQYKKLQELGYIGNGALGWEKVAGQVGGGHYDLHIGSQVKADNSDQYLSNLKRDFDEKMRMEKEKKEIEEKNKKKEEDIKFAKEHPYINQAMQSAQKAVQKVNRDLSGMKDYTDRQNVTNATVNVGAN